MLSLGELNSSQKRTQFVSLVHGHSWQNSSTNSKGKQVQDRNSILQTIHKTEVIESFLLGNNPKEYRNYNDDDLLGLNLALYNALEVDEIFSSFIEYLDALMNDSENPSLEDSKEMLSQINLALDLGFEILIRFLKDLLENDSLKSLMEKSRLIFRNKNIRNSRTIFNYVVERIREINEIEGLVARNNSTAPTLKLYSEVS